MLTRVYIRKNSAYVGFTVCDEWLTFTNFRKWAIKNKYQKGFELDKDLYSDGTKIYSPKTCCFLPSRINKFLIASNGRHNTGYPTGLSFHKESSRIRVSMSRDGSKHYYGAYDNVTEALNKYNTIKTEILIELLVAWKYSDLPYNNTVSDKLLEKYACSAGTLTYDQLMQSLRSPIYEVN